MKLQSKLATVLFLVLTFSSISLFAQEEMSAEQKAWMDFMTPGEMHKMLASNEGEWTTETLMWHSPDAEPERTTGSANFEMILGGRYSKSSYKGTSMGMPFDGLSIEGFDNATGEFFSTWFDTFGTGIAFAKGKYDPEKKAIVSYGSMTNPVDGSEWKFKTVGQFKGENKRVFEMYMDYNGEEIKTMSMTLTRK